MAGSIAALVRMLLSSPTPEAQDAFSLAKAHMATQMPEKFAQANITPMSNWDRWMMPGTAGYQDGRNIRVNLHSVEGQPQQLLDDTLAHELTHVGQTPQPGLVQRFVKTLTSIPEPETPYFLRPDELEAYGAEDRRRWMRQDIPLSTGTRPPLPVDQSVLYGLSPSHHDYALPARKKGR